MKPSRVARGRAARAGAGSRRGAGAMLVVGAVFLLVMALMGLAQSFFASQVSDVASRASLGRLALLVAESAVEEARGVLAERANGPAAAGPLFASLRPAVEPPRGAALGSLELGLADLPHTQALMATKGFDGFELVGPVRVDVRYGQPLNYTVGGDFAATAVCRARVGFRQDRTIVRDLTETAAIKLNHVALPAPLARAAVIVKAPVQISRGGAAADDEVECSRQGVCVNRLVRTILDDHIGRVRREYDDLLRQLQSRDARRAPFINRVRPLYQRVTSDGGVNHIRQVEDFRGTIRPYPPFPAPAEATVAAAVGPEVDLRRINLQRRLVPLSAAQSTSMGDLARLGATVSEGFRSNDSSEAAYQNNVRYTQVLIDHLRVLTDILTAVREFQVTVRLADETRGGRIARAFVDTRALLARIDPGQLAGGWNLLSQRADFLVEEDPPGAGRRDVTARLGELLSRLDAAGSGASGIVYVFNDRDVLTISGAIKGKLIIAVAGPCLVDAARAAGPHDVLTIIAGGGDRAPVRVRGQVRASLVLGGSRLTIEPLTTIEGTLVLDDIAAASAPRIEGTVRADPRLADSNAPALWYACVSPWLRNRVVERK